MNFTPTAFPALSSFPSRSGSEVNSARAGRKASRGDIKQPLSGAQVLVVEDEFIIALELQANFEDAGAKVVGPAYTLAQAVELARHAEITAATLDMRLARDSISPVVAILARRGIPLLFYSGQPQADPVFAEWPQYRTISKPAKPEELVEAVSELVVSKKRNH